MEAKNHELSYRASILCHHVVASVLGVLAEETFSGANAMGEYSQHRRTVDNVSSSREPSFWVIV